MADDIISDSQDTLHHIELFSGEPPPIPLHEQDLFALRPLYSKVYGVSPLRERVLLLARLTPNPAPNVQVLHPMIPSSQTPATDHVDIRSISFVMCFTYVCV